MRVNVTRSGDVSIDVDTTQEAAALVSELLRGNAKTPRRKRVASSRPRELESSESLSGPLVETWNWLVAHDNVDGCRAEEVAEGLGIQVHSCNYRLGKLVEKELAHRVSPGHYRAGG